jgi:hypothetical protein
LHTKNNRDLLSRSDLIEYWFNVTRKSDQLALFQSRIETQLKEMFFDNTMELLKLTAERDRILSSNSWKLTKPLRKMGNIFRSSKKQRSKPGNPKDSK